MESTLQPKPADDPHDMLVVATDAARISPAEDEIASLLRGAARQRPEPQARKAPDVAIGARVPAVDTTFRATAVDDVPGTAMPRPKGRWATRGLTALVLTACIGGAAFAWQTEGDAARQMIGQFTPLLTSLLSAGKTEAPAQPAAQAVEAEATNAAPQATSPQPVIPAQAAQPATPVQAATDAATNAAAASAESAQLLQSMQHDVASLTQQVEQLKATIDELKAGQQQLNRDVAKATEQNLRSKIAKLPAGPPRTVAAHPRKPMQTYYPPAPAQATSPLPPATAAYPAAAPYYPPRQIEPPPQAASEQDEPESSVPRPPMPVR